MIQRMVLHYQKFLNAALKSPDKSIALFPLMGEEERLLLDEWNDTGAEYPQDVLLHQLFEAQAKRTPEAIALVFEETSLTYRQLNRRANSVAKRLLDLGVGPETLVGIYLERSLEMEIALLGTLKAGGAYVPLDPEYPRQRLAFLLEDIQAPVILTQKRLLDTLPATSQTVLCLDDDDTFSNSAALDENPQSGAGPENLAYVIYTSGSTGKPKGVMNTHRGICNRILWTQDTYRLTDADRILQKTPMSFDVSVWEFFWPLMAGARLVMARPGGHRDSAYLVKKINRDRITTLHFVPSMLQIFLQEEGVDSCRTLKRVICSGEALSRNLQERFHKRSKAELHNLYGPTEAAVDVTYWPCKRGNRRQSVPIGKPVANTQIHVLDERLRPVPIGTPGELHIGGAQVARGYLNRPDLTAEKFIPDPFRSAPGARLYKTGDLARYLPDGNLEYLGRLDFQVKIRGNRIELGEIEACLNKHPDVQESVLVAWKDPAEDARLVAYLVAGHARAPQSSVLREFLRTSLPNYMIPSFFVFLERFPLTPNGKIDRKALPSPKVRREDMDEPYTAPRTDMESLIADVWKEVLNTSQVGAHDDFFDMGGHSLLATLVVSRLARALDCGLSIRDLFEAPTVAKLAAQIESDNRSKQKRASLPPILPIKRENTVSLSLAQERLWFVGQLEPESAAYNVAQCLRISGSLDADALRAAFRAIVSRHEPLRSTFISVNGKPRAIISDTGDAVIETIRPDSAEKNWDETDALLRIKREARRPFDLQSGPLARSFLIPLSETEWYFVLIVHHINFDGWSFGIFLRELGNYYEAFLNGRPALPDPSPINYYDYTSWQRDWLVSQDLSDQKSYWKQKLDGELPVLNMPTDHPRPKRATSEGGLELFRVPSDLSNDLKALSQREGATLFMTLLAGFQVLLSRFCRQDDIIVGIPMANRECVETEDLIGLFLNTLAIRSDLSGDEDFRSFLAQVRKTTLEAYSNQDLPFEQVLEAVQPAREMTHHPLYQSMFAFQSYSMPAPNLPDIKFTPVVVDRGSSLCDLVLYMWEENDEILGAMEFASALFDSSTIARLLSRYLVLMEGIAASPDCPIKRLPLLTEEEQRQVLVEWNPKEADASVKKCVYEVYEFHAENTPSKIAVISQGEEITYGEMSQQSNQLARYLQSLGIGRGCLVGILLDRSLDMMVSILGIWKSGAAYVPLDSLNPQKRLSEILDEARVSVILSQEALLGVLPEIETQVLVLDTEWERIKQESSDALALPCDARDLAYVIFTSGSTGKPKGAMIEHGALAHLAESVAVLYELRPSDRVLQFFSFSFDGSFLDMIASCMRGATLVLRTDEMLSSVPVFVEDCRRLKLTVINLITSFWHLLVSEIETVTFPSTVRLVVIAGESVRADALERWQSVVGGDSRLLNVYGPTECTVISTACDITNLRPAQSVPIGRHLVNTQIYILDSHLQPSPIGVPGELCIGGPQLARGYLNHPEMTSEVFTPNPFSSTPGSRLYRSGDLARFLPDGNIEFLGRLDQQVKVRGYRIELSEIESALKRHDALQDAIVTTRESASGENCLVAYLIVPETQSLRAGDLRSFLKDSLPDYMIPTAYVVLESFPKTQTGKIDRKALPAPDITRELAEAIYVAPQSPLEEIVAGIWSKVLGVDQVSVQDNFFDLGGHSLLAARVVSRVSEATLCSVSVRDIFESPTVTQLASRIESNRRSEGEYAPTPPVCRVDREHVLRLSFTQERFWFLEQLEPERSVYSVPLCFRIAGPLDVDALRESFRIIVSRHELLRASFPVTNGKPGMVIETTSSRMCPSLRVNEPEKWQSRANGTEGESEALEWLTKYVEQPFDLRKGGLARFLLLKLDKEQFLLTMVFHHIVFDGWSRDVLLEELSALYDAFSHGKSLTLPDLPFQYADYVDWHRRWIIEAGLEEQIAYWKEHLAGELPPLALPSDRPRPPTPSYRGALEKFSLSPDLTRSLHRLSRREGATLFMTLLAAFKTLLHRYSGQQDILVASPVANRNPVETEQLIGLFLNMITLRTEVSPDIRFLDVVARAREATLEALARQDLPFERLIDILQPARDLSYHSVFQAMFAFQNFAYTPLKLKNLATRPFLLDPGATALDLSLYMWEEDEKLTGGLEYNNDIFDPPTIKRLLGHFRTLLEGVVADPEALVRQLPILPMSERAALLADSRGARCDYPSEAVLPDLFEAQARRAPDAMAVVCGEQRLTYGELDRRANQLAWHLRELGVETETLVAVCLERSLDLAVALLAVLKAGGAYVPLDPAFPKQRLAFMIEDAQAPVLLTQQSLFSDQDHSAEGTKIVLVDSRREEISQASVDAPPRTVGAEDLAYVIYTSGSTGKPKGVEIPHRALVNFLSSMRVKPGLTTDDILLSVTTSSFDIFGLELFLPLTTGARAVLADRETATDGRALLRLLASSAATVMQATPATWRMLLATGWKEAKGLKVLCGGEALPRDLADALLATGAELWNLYGPTETTIWSSLCRVEPDSAPPRIGSPIANTEFYVLDPWQQPVPVNVPGELYIGGDGLARGYRNRPSLTEAYFIPHPFSDQPGARLYRTGDQVRRLSDGGIETLGRLDNQVKIRGFRIELGEIEAALEAHPNIRQAVVACREDAPGDPKLVAYVISEKLPPPEINDLRSSLKERLPDYMIPSWFEFLEAFPLTPNNKVDRRSLPKPTMAAGGANTEDYIAPRDPIEEQLTEIWKNLLGTKQISVRDDFFKLGGHSLLAAQLFYEIEQLFGQNIPLATLFQGPTIEHLASILRQETTEKDWPSLTSIQAAGSRPPLFLVHGAEGNVLLYRELAKSLGEDQPVYGLQSRGLDGQTPPLTSIEAMAEAYVDEIRQALPMGPYCLGGYCLGGAIAFEMARLLRVQGQEVAFLALFETYNTKNASAVPISDHRMLRALQNHWFHFDNIFSLGAAEGLHFFLQKAKVSLSRLRSRSHINFSEIWRKLWPSGEVRYHHIQIEKVNDGAFDTYTPKPYPGKITLFLPHKQFVGLNDPEYGWGGLAEEGVDVRTLAVNPRGMLVAPFQQELADCLNECMRAAQEKQDDNQDQRAKSEDVVSARPTLQK